VVGLSLIYLLGALALLPGFRHEINPDGISYISIARRYLAGDLRGAVNGYWGPLFSWALVPFLAASFAALMLVTYVEPIAMLLPRLLGYAH
jgi:hypothetical protein